MRKFSDSVQDRFGNALSATVTVRIANVTPGTGALATIYASDTTPLSAPITGSFVTTDANGKYEFYAVDGRYDLTISGTGITTVTLTDTGDGNSVFAYGAVGDGVTDDSAAFNACATANSTVVVPGGYTYALTASTVNILSGQTWICNGATFTQASSTKTMFAATTVNDWQFFGGKLTGSGNGSAGSGTAEILFKVTDCLRFRVSYVTCNNSQGWGFKRVSANAPAYRGEGGQYPNCLSIGCYIGAEATAGSGSEYSTWTNFQAVNCGTGVLIGAGNTSFLGGSSSDNVNGVVLVGGANHGHGTIVGMNINHNTTDNVLATSVVNGFTFSDCHLYANSAATGFIHLNASSGIEFSGCMIDSNIKNDAATGSNNFFLENYMVSNTAILGPAGTSGSTNLVLAGNQAPSGPWAFDNLFQVTNGNVISGAKPAGFGTVGDIATSRSSTTAAIYFGSDGNAYIFRNGNAFTFGQATSIGSANDGTCDAGSSGSRYRDLYSSRALRTGQTAATDLAGSVALSGGTATVNFSQTYASTPVVLCDSRTANRAYVSAVSTSSFTITGTGTDTVDYHIIVRT